MEQNKKHRRAKDDCKKHRKTNGREFHVQVMLKLLMLYNFIFAESRF